MNKRFMRKIAPLGGKAGTGIKKVRGDSAYYSALSKKRKTRKKGRE